MCNIYSPYSTITKNKLGSSAAIFKHSYSNQAPKYLFSTMLHYDILVIVYLFAIARASSRPKLRFTLHHRTCAFARNGLAARARSPGCMRTHLRDATYLIACTCILPQIEVLCLYTISQCSKYNASYVKLLMH